MEVPREGVGPQIGERQRRGGLRGRARSCRPDRAEWGLIGYQGGGRARKGPWGLAREGGTPEMVSGDRYEGA